MSLTLHGPHPPVEVGLLWVELLRFYALEFNMADNVICVRTAVVLSREMKDWPKKRIAVEGQKPYHISIYTLGCRKKNEGDLVTAARKGYN